MNMVEQWDSSASQISVFTGRGTLVESQGPCWFYGSGSEHSTLYQYQLYKAKNIYMGHIQSETPYYQPVPVAPKPFDTQKGLFAGDPTFTCKDGKDSCKTAWALRIIDSTNIYMHSLGLYSFFVNYAQDCLKTFNCQDRLLEVKGSKNVALFNIFTIGAKEAGTGAGNAIVYQNDTQK